MELGRAKSCEGPCEATAQGWGHNPAKPAQQFAFLGCESPTAAPELEEAPASVLVTKDGRHDVVDAIARQDSSHTRLWDRSPAVASTNVTDVSEDRLVHRFVAVRYFSRMRVGRSAPSSCPWAT